MKLLAIIWAGYVFFPIEWKSWKGSSFTMNYTVEDERTYKKYTEWISEGQQNTEKFFDQKFNQSFSVYLHPTRQSLDEQWQKDWQMPDFKSECWMVASGVATKLDLLSPRVWDSQSCEHTEADVKASRELITHELVHVFHGQQNASPDFSTADGIDWLVEGLATYASGQLNEAKLKEVKSALAEGKVAIDLSKFWTGKMKYGLSGSMVMYVDKAFGRKKLKSLLTFATKNEILNSLGVSETELLIGWKKFIEDLKV
jgi:hypothetical protein